VMAAFNISFSELVNIVISSDHEVHKCLENLKCIYPNLTETMLMQIYKEFSRNFLPKFTKRWHAATRNRTKLKKNEDWLKNIFSINEPPTEPGVTTEEPGPSKRSRSGPSKRSWTPTGTLCAHVTYFINQVG
jgi:hypothetical protein